MTDSTEIPLVGSTTVTKTMTVDVASTGTTLHLPDIPMGTGLLGTLLTVIGAVLVTRRKISRNNLDVKRDSAEKDILTTLQEERDKAMRAAEKAWASRATDAQLIGKLSSEVKHLSETNLSMREEVTSLREEIHELRKIIMDFLPGHPLLSNLDNLGSSTGAS